MIQPNTEGLMFTGNEKVWPFLQAGAAGAARPQGAGARRYRRRQHGHRPAAQTGRRSLGVQIRYETGAAELIVDESGAVTGATWKQFSETGAIRAKSVIIAAGGFVMNPDMVAMHTPKLAEKPFVLGNTYDDGLGIRMGVSPVAPPGTWTRSSSPHRPTRRRSCSPGSSSTSSDSGSSPRTPTTRGLRVSSWISRIVRRF